MVYLFYTTHISVELAQHKIFRAKVGKGGIKQSSQHLCQHWSYNQATTKLAFHFNETSKDKLSII